VSGGLDGATAIVTGAAGGQGAAVCRRLAAEGADILAIDARSTAEVVAQVKSSGRRGWGMELDLADRVAMRSELPGRFKELPAIDVLVCCAGILTRTTFEDLGDAEWDQVLAVNLTSAFVVTQLAWARLKESRRPSAVYVTSKAAVSPSAKQSAAYVASKGGLQSLVYLIAMAGAPHRIRANGIAPGPIATPMLGAAAEQAAQSTPLGRVGVPEDIAAAAYYLASPESAFVTGAILNISGGRQLG
jgi:NAD(P)-dependent dehydrogenase (short-subunit alcohol dehydrogenase family)